MGQIYDSLSRKHKLFVDNYIKCKFNGTRAYLQTYPRSQTKSAVSGASSLFSDHPKIQAALTEKVGELKIFENTTVDEIWQEIYETQARFLTNPNAVVRMVELKARCKGMMKELSLNVQTNILKEAEERVKNRLVRSDEKDKGIEQNSSNE